MASLTFLFLLVLVSLSTQQNSSSTAYDSYISTGTYIGTILAGTVNLFNGPISISNAPTSTTTTLPTEDQIKYFNYFTASSYCTSQLKDLTCDYCQKFKSDSDPNVVIVNNADVNILAYIVVQSVKQQIVVTFQGSYNLANVVEDGSFFQGDVTRKIKVHTGFFVALMSIYYPVVTEIQRALALNPTFKVIILGHSLGAAMASLSTFFFTFNKQFPGVPLTLITYGQPRTGNKGYVDYMNKLTIPMARVVSRADNIPHLAPVSSAAIDEPYYHHATEYWINGTAAFCSNEVYEDQDCSDSLDPVYSPFDHGYYLDANYFSCWFGDPIHLLTLPFSLLNTQTGFPLIPSKLYTRFTQDLVGIVFQALVPYMG